MDDNKSQKIPTVKIKFFGTTNVGITSIIERFSSCNFPEIIFVTAGFNRKEKFLIINDTKINCDLWEIPGQKGFFYLIGKKIFERCIYSMFSI